MDGKLVTDGDRQVCVSCYLWNHWHERGEPCDIRGCECPLSAQPRFWSRWPDKVNIHT